MQKHLYQVSKKSLVRFQMNKSCLLFCYKRSEFVWFLSILDISYNFQPKISFNKKYRIDCHLVDRRVNYLANSDSSQNISGLGCSNVGRRFNFSQTKLIWSFRSNFLLLFVVLEAMLCMAGGQLRYCPIYVTPQKTFLLHSLDQIELDFGTKMSTHISLNISYHSPQSIVPFPHSVLQGVAKKN